MFKLWVVVLGHKNFWNLRKIIHDLTHDNIFLYIHIDANNIELYTQITELSNTNIKVFSEYKCKWWSFSLVLAALHCMRRAQDDNIDYITIISWEDIALKNSNEIYNFFKKEKSSNFIDYRKLNNNDFWDYKLLKLDTYFFFFKWIVFSIPITRWKNESLFYCSQWININKETLRVIIKYIDDNPRITRFFRFSFSPDNFFFSTIISKTIGFENCINHNLRNITWDNDSVNYDVKIYHAIWKYFHPRTPKQITDEDILKQWKLSNRYLFARKYKQTNS